jgi:hypothetical protein
MCPIQAGALSRLAGACPGHGEPGSALHSRIVSERSARGLGTGE